MNESLTRYTFTFLLSAMLHMVLAHYFLNWHQTLAPDVIGEVQNRPVRHITHRILSCYDGRVFIPLLSLSEQLYNKLHIKFVIGVILALGDSSI